MIRRPATSLVLAVLCAALLSPDAIAQSRPDPKEVLARVPRLRPQVISVRPHDPQAFTQGLELNGGLLYESTGLFGRSTLRETNPADGSVLRAARLPNEVFAEGITFVGDDIYMLTWKQESAIVFDRVSLRAKGQLPYKGEGWGIAYDGTHLVMSNGTANLAFRDVATFDVVTSVTVNLLGEPVHHINELEFAEGHIWANVWQMDLIVKIEPATGNIAAVVNAANLLTAEERAKADVLNGIAYDRRTRTFLLTGKNWPKTFEVVFVPDG